MFVISDGAQVIFDVESKIFDKEHLSCGLNSSEKMERDNLQN